MSVSLSPRTRVAAGLLAIAFYGLRAGLYLSAATPQHLLWSCHLACLLVGIGLVSASPALNATGFLWAVIGFPCWLLDLAMGGAFFAASFLTHVGALLLGGLGVRSLGWPSGMWWKSTLALAGLHALTRAISPPDGNVNLAFAVWSGWEGYFPSHGAYLLLLACLTATVFFLTGRILQGAR